APFQALGKTDVDILIAGCGTGQHPIGMAQRFAGARLLAVDLSLASLGYALRKTRALGLDNVAYAQADILKLGVLDRRFDMIDSRGGRNHLADPADGWCDTMTPTPRPGGGCCCRCFGRLSGWRSAFTASLPAATSLRGARFAPS